MGPFSYSTPKGCFNLIINDDFDVERDEIFTLEIEGEPSHVKIGNRTVQVTIESEDGELAPDYSSIMQIKY